MVVTAVEVQVSWPMQAQWGRREGVEGVWRREVVCQLMP